MICERTAITDPLRKGWLSFSERREKKNSWSLFHLCLSYSLYLKYISTIYSSMKPFIIISTQSNLSFFKHSGMNVAVTSVLIHVMYLHIIHLFIKINKLSGKKFELSGGSLILGKNRFELDRKVGVKNSDCQNFTHLKWRIQSMAFIAQLMILLIYNK